MTGAVKKTTGVAVRQGAGHAMTATLPEETPVALVYNGSTQAVMMASPQDLREFAVGFSLSERIVELPSQIENLEVVAHDAGIEVRMWLGDALAEALAARRRSMAGPVGCGLCGIDSLDEALRPLPDLRDRKLDLGAAQIDDAAASLMGHQPLHDQTRSVHAAGFVMPGKGVVLVREDVGRHNALDKLIGALALTGQDPAKGAIVITSRVSVDMVQKCAIAGAPVLIAVSAPTAHAVRLADAAGLTLVAQAKGNGFDIFTHPDRIPHGAQSNVA